MLFHRPPKNLNAVAYLLTLANLFLFLMFYFRGSISVVLFPWFYFRGSISDVLFLISACTASISALVSSQLNGALTRQQARHDCTSNTPMWEISCRVNGPACILGTCLVHLTTHRAYGPGLANISEYIHHHHHPSTSFIIIIIV